MLAVVRPFASVGAIVLPMPAPAVQVPLICALGTGWPFASVNTRVTEPPLPPSDDGDACKMRLPLAVIGTSSAGVPGPSVKVTAGPLVPPPADPAMPLVVNTPLVQPSAPVGFAKTPEFGVPSILPVPRPRFVKPNLIAAPWIGAPRLSYRHT